jgi:uncharacterized RDD family membrane protein YckC
MGKRFVAYLIDGILIGVVGSILGGLGIGGTADPSNLFDVTNYIGSYLSALIYYLAFAYFNNGVTVGKMVFKLSIKSDGGSLDKSKLMIREALKVLLMPIVLISFIVCLVNDDRKSIHDLLVNTVVTE